MRTVFIGAGEISIETARALGRKGHEVIIIEADKAKIEELSEGMDCSFVHGDGSRPDILGEVNPEQTDFLFCLTNNDQDNVIASLVGRSLGFKRVVTSIADEEFSGICRELGLEDTIIPSRTISRYLQDLVNGVNNVDLSAVLKDEARAFMFTAREDDAVVIKRLQLPGGARVICRYRENKFAHADEETKLQKGDEVVILTHSKHLGELEKRWPPKLREETDRESDSYKESG
jgi:trk system potassium uptake protein TrkA